MKEVHVNIQPEEDRKNFIVALANSGYKVTVKEESDSTFNKTYWVIFEVPENTKKGN